MESSKCPKCGDDPHFIAHVDKWYCFGCNSYVGEADEEAEEVHAESEIPSSKSENPLAACQAPAGATVVECKSCGAELQGLKDGRLYCFMCETYQDEIDDTHGHIENEAQALVDHASVPTPCVAPIVPQEPVIPQPAPIPVQPAPAPEVKPVEVTPTPAPSAVAAPAPVQPPVASAPVPPVAPTPAELPAPPPEKPAYVRMCTSCGQPLKYIDKYQRYYCYGCKKYASKDEKLKGMSDKKKCPECGGELRFIEKYNEHYCNSCKKYPLKAASKPAGAKAEVLSCPKCSSPLKWVEKYSRHYCYTCKEYAPKGFDGNVVASTAGDKKTCPACNESMKFIAEYNEWYCYKCRKYSLRPSKPAMFL